MAVISLTHDWVYIHIPKNGGYATTEFLRRNVGVGYVVDESGSTPEELVAYGIEKHCPALKIRRWMEMTGRDWDRFDSFAVIRDPYTRPESVFWEIRRTWPFWQIVVNGWDTSSSMARDWWTAFTQLRDVNQFIESGMYDPAGPFYMTWPQWWYISEDGQPLVHHLFRVSSASREIPKLVGIDGMIPWAHTGGYERTTLTTAARQRVKDWYAIDFELLDEATP